MACMCYGHVRSHAPRPRAWSERWRRRDSLHERDSRARRARHVSGFASFAGVDPVVLVPFRVRPPTHPDLSRNVRPPTLASPADRAAGKEKMQFLCCKVDCLMIYAPMWPTDAFVRRSSSATLAGSLGSRTWPIECASCAELCKACQNVRAMSFCAPCARNDRLCTDADGRGRDGRTDGRGTDGRTDGRDGRTDGRTEAFRSGCHI